MFFFFQTLLAASVFRRKKKKENSVLHLLLLQKYTAHEQISQLYARYPAYRALDYIETRNSNTSFLGGPCLNSGLLSYEFEVREVDKSEK